MAGGRNARFVPCMVCLERGKVTRAIRVIDGVESNQYVCWRLHRFGMTWRDDGPQEPLWPPREK